MGPISSTAADAVVLIGKDQGYKKYNMYILLIMDMKGLLLKCIPIKECSGKKPDIFHPNVLYNKKFDIQPGKLIEWKIALFHEFFFCQINIRSKSSDQKICMILVKKVL